MNVLNRIRQIDFLRTAGVGSVLGLDITAERAFFVELGRTGSLLNRYRSEFRPLKSFSLRFQPEPPDRAPMIREALQANNIETRLVAVTLRPSSVKTVTVDIPAGVTDVRLWVQENGEKLLRLPIAPGTVDFEIESLPMEGEKRRVRIHFVRVDELTRLRQTIAESGLVACCIGVGVRDLANLLLLTGQDEDKVLFSEASMATVLTFENESVSERMVPVSGLEAELGSVNPEPTRHVWVAGELEAFEPAQHARPLRYYDFQPMFSLATGLATRAWLPELGAVDFRSTDEKEKATAWVLRRALTRVVKVCGLVLMILLGLEYAASALLQSEWDRIENELSASSRAHSAIRQLEQEISDLKGSLEGSAPEAERTHAAHILHGIGEVVPDRVLANRVVVEQGQTRSVVFNGTAGSAEDITALLKSMQKIFDDARLVRTGSETRSEGAFVSKRVGREDLEFEVVGNPR